MANIQPITRKQYADKRWQRPSDFSFATDDVLCRLSVHELAKAATSLPIAFMPTEENYSLAAVLGLEAGNNLFVAPNGRWISSYTPVVYRSYPFMLVNRDDGQQVLCIDEDSGIVTDGEEGELFFFEDGELAPFIAQILKLLNQSSANLRATAKVCEILNNHKLIKPWEIKLQRAQGEQILEGLYYIDQGALSKLSGKALKELRDAGALHTAYCQLMSMQHIGNLPRLDEAHASMAKRMETVAQSIGDFTLDSEDDGGSISFDHL